MSGNLGRGAEAWELKTMGKTVEERTARVAENVRHYRNITKLPPNHETQKAHDRYIHETGADMLKIQSSSALTSAKEEKLRKKLQGKPRLPQKEVKVDLLDEDGFTIALDLEWDTSTWGNTEIEAGTEALINVFDAQVGPHRRQQAVRMLNKMLERHKVAEKTLQKNIAPMMHRAMSRRIKGGKCLAALNVLFALHTAMSRFYFEISSNNFMEKFWNMVQMEAHLAATIIQHAYRTHRELKFTRHADVAPLAQGWSTQEEVVQKRIKHLLYRGGELRTQWTVLHFYQRREERKALYGMRGPVHVPIVYMKVGLEICEFILSVKAKDQVHVNRDDCLYVHAEILLVGFVSACSSEISKPAVSVVNSIALNEYSLRPLIRAGILKAIIKYIHYYRNNFDEFQLMQAISVISRIGRHCAGLHRAKDDYDYIEKQDYCDDTHPAEVNYRSLLLSYKHKELDDYRTLLCNKKLSFEMVNLFYSLQSIRMKVDILNCFNVLAGSSCFTVIFEEVTRLNGQFLQALIDMFEYEKGEEKILGDLSIALLIQLNTHEACRAGMRSSNVLSMLKSLMEDEAYFPRVSYKRASFLLMSLCRVGEWRSYVPQRLLEDAKSRDSLNFITYMDMMKTIKQPPPGSQMSFKELISLESNIPMVNVLGELVKEVGCRDVIDFYTCPMSNHHFSTLPFDIAMAGCSIIAAIVQDVGNAKEAVSSHVVRYLGQCLHWAYSEIATRANSKKHGEFLLFCVHSCTTALVAICEAGVSNKKDCTSIFVGVRDSQAYIAARYFMTVFSNASNDDLPPDIRKLQDKVSLHCVRFMEKYAAALLFLKTPDSDQGLEDLSNAIGSAASRVVNDLPRVMGQSPKALRVLDYLCHLLAKLVATSAGRFLAFKTWKLPEVLLLHLPKPLCAVGDVQSETSLYKNSARDLPSSLFDVMVQLCQTDQGIAISVADGFLRRALDKIFLIKDRMESESEMEQVAITIANGKQLPKNQLRLDMASSLQLVSKCCNYHNSKFGSSNDLVLNPNYSIVEVCWRLASTPSCPRDDEAYLASLSVLRQLSRDSARIYEQFRDHEIVPLIHNELKRLSEIPLEGVADCVDLIYNVAVGLRGAHLRAELPRMREALSKVSRIHVRLGQAVSDALYAISRNHGKMPEEDEVREGPIGGTQDMKDLLLLSSQQEREDFERQGKPGTYERCGVSTCGGLGVPGGCAGHGEYLESDPTTKSKTMRMRVDANISSEDCHLTKLSARDESMRKDLILKKEKEGYIELTEEDFSSLKLPTVTPSKSMRRKNSSSKSRDIWSPIKTGKSSKPKPSSKKHEHSKDKSCGGVITSVDIADLPELKNTRPMLPPPRQRNKNV